MSRVMRSCNWYITYSQLIILERRNNFNSRRKHTDKIHGLNKMLQTDDEDDDDEYNYTQTLF